MPYGHWRPEQGKTYRVEITGDSLHDATFRLSAVYDISCES